VVFIPQKHFLLIKLHKSINSLFNLILTFIINKLTTEQSRERKKKNQEWCNNSTKRGQRKFAGLIPALLAAPHHHTALEQGIKGTTKCHDMAGQPWLAAGKLPMGTPCQHGCGQGQAIPALWEDGGTESNRKPHTCTSHKASEWIPKRCCCLTVTELSQKGLFNSDSTQISCGPAFLQRFH